MEQNAKKVPSPSKGILQSEDLYQVVLYHSPFSNFQIFLVKYSI